MMDQENLHIMMVLQGDVWQSQDVLPDPVSFIQTLLSSGGSNFWELCFHSDIDRDTDYYMLIIFSNAGS